VQTGSQNRRIIRPIGVAGPTRVKISFSWEVSMLASFANLTSLEGRFHGSSLLRKIRRPAAVSQRSRWVTVPVAVLGVVVVFDDQSAVACPVAELPSPATV
jgi:hypothetical protein